MPRLLPALTLALALLGGCAAPPYVAGRRVAPPTPPDVAHEEARIEAKGGVQLLRQAWRPPQGEARAVVVIVHGLKDYSDRYQEMAIALARRGHAVHAIDLRGHGDSSGPRVWVDQFDDYLADLDLLMDHTRQAEQGRPIFLFGHSMGGAISTLYTMTRKPPLGGLILSAAALKTEESAFVTGPARATGVLFPRLAVFSLDDKNFSRDPSIVASMKTDPLIYDDNAPANTARQVLNAIDRIRDSGDQLTVPLLALHGTLDKVTPPSGSRDLVDHAASKDKTLKLYDGLVHDLVHEPEKQTVMTDIETWIEGHLPPAPSR